MQNLVRSYILQHLRNAERQLSQTALTHSQATFFSTEDSVSAPKPKRIPRKTDNILSKIKERTTGQFEPGIRKDKRRKTRPGPNTDQNGAPENPPQKNKSLRDLFAPREEESDKASDRHNQTVYYNIRKQYYEDKNRQKYYYRDDDKLVDAAEIRKRLKATKTTEDVLRLYQAHKFTFSTDNMITALSMLAKHQPLDRKQNRRFNEQREKPKNFTYTHKEKRIASLLYSLQMNRKTFKGDEFVIILWALTRMKFQETELFILSQDAVFELLPEISSDYLAMLIWVLSKNEVKHAKQYGLISIELCKRLKELKEKDNFILKEAIKNKIAEEKVNTKDQLKGAVEDTEEKLEEEEEYEDEEEDEVDIETESQLSLLSSSYLSSRSVGLILWSFNRLSIEDDELFELLGELTQKNLQCFNLLSLSLVLRELKGKKFSKLKADLVEALDKYDLEKEKSTLTLKTLMVALSERSTPNQKLETKILRRILSINKETSAKFSSELLRAAVLGGVREEELIMKLVQNIEKKIDHLNAKDMVMTFQALLELRRIQQEEQRANYAASLRPTIEIITAKIVSSANVFDKTALRILRSIVKKYDVKNAELLSALNAREETAV